MMKLIRKKSLMNLSHYKSKAKVFSDPSEHRWTRNLLFAPGDVLRQCAIIGCSKSSGSSQRRGVKDGKGALASDGHMEITYQDKKRESLHKVV